MMECLFSDISSLLRLHQGWAWRTSSVNLGFLPSVSPWAARLRGGSWALAENDPSGLIVFWPADWHWEEKQRHGEGKRGGWVLMHLAAIREAYLTVWAQHANTHTRYKYKGKDRYMYIRHTYAKVKAWLLLKTKPQTQADTRHGWFPLDGFPPPFSPVINLPELTLVQPFILRNLNKNDEPL